MAACVFTGNEDEKDGKNGLPPATEGGGTRGVKPRGEPQPDAGGDSMGASVTPHADSPPDRTWKFLACGVDSLYLAGYVDWGKDWSNKLKDLENGREQAQAADRQVLWKTLGTEPVLIYPTGKAPMYRFHLHLREFHVYLAQSGHGDSFPNVYVNLNSKAIWEKGVLGAVASLTNFISQMDGTINQLKPSRCDMCADFHYPGGILLDVLRECGIPKDITTCDIMNGAVLETFYIGSPGASIRARIYDKGKEIQASRKPWFLNIWGIDRPEDVWRVEFQLRRPAVKNYSIETIDDLMAKQAGLWQNLTTEWYSLRLPDNNKTARRSFHPFWRNVQACAEKFGPLTEVKRNLLPGNLAGADYYATRAANMMLNHAALLGIFDYDEAIGCFTNAINDKWLNRNFDEEITLKIVELHGPASGEGKPDDDIPI